MNYHLKSKSKFPLKNKIIGIVAVFIFLSLFGFLFSNFTRSTSYFFTKPVWKVGSVIWKPFSSIGGFFSSKNKLQSEMEVLELELLSLRLKGIDYEVLSKENEDLKRQLGRVSSTNRVISRVLSKPPRSPYDTLVIDVGSLHNISIGSKVYSGDNVIVGLIKEVTSNTSLVELFSTGDRRQDSISLRTGATFILVGKGGANFELEVPKDTDILWGDVFVYPSISSSVLGNVYFIDTSSQSTFKTIHIRIPGNIFQSQWVFIE